MALLLVLTLLGGWCRLVAAATGPEACGTPVCHNSTTAWSGDGPRMNEYRAWRDEDAHRHSRAILLDDRSQQIARRLGGEPADRRADCLACHADTTDAAADVGCATCHGTGDWVAVHSRPGASHTANVAAGLYPADDPRRRAELCANCHVGGRAPAVVDHRLLAAGHPRLVLDLDTLSTLQPAHYRSRGRGKRRSTAAALWATGQGVALARRLERAADTATASGGWPDPAAFDCASCHHQLGVRPASVAPPATVGLPQAEASARVAYGVALAAIAPSDVAQLDAADDVRATLATVDAWRPDPASLRALLVGLAAAGADGAPPSYTTAEQLFYGIQATLVTIKKRDALDQRTRRRVRRHVRRLYEEIAAHDRYDARAFQAALRAIRAALG